METAVEATVVIATRNRQQQLLGVLASLAAQVDAPSFDIVVVDDGSEPPLDLSNDQAVTINLLRTDGMGPARARNCGWRAASGEIVLFTDDDVEVDAHWVAAACETFASDPTLVAVEGRVDSPPYDRLFAYSVEATRGQMGLTCNIAYRRTCLAQLGGFHEGFPHAHCEDIDLLLRARHRGRTHFHSGMVVLHHPRSMSISDFARRGSWAASQLLLIERHRAAHPRLIPARIQPLVSALRYWSWMAYMERGKLVRDPRRGARLVAIATRYIANTVASSFAAGSGARADDGRKLAMRLRAHLRRRDRAAE